MSTESIISPQWGKKRMRDAQAARMREAKRLKALKTREQPEVLPELESEEPVATEEVSSPVTTSAVMSEEPEQPMLQASLGERELISQDFEEDPESGAEDDDEETSPQEVFDDWMLTLTVQQRKMLSVILYESFMNRQQMSKMSAAQEAASITGSLSIYHKCMFTGEIHTGFSERTVRGYRKEFFDNNLKFKESRQGKHERLLILSSEELRKEASQWVRDNAFKKGEPNMTAGSFCEYVNSTLLPSQHLPPHFPRTISLRTATRWLHRLGFKPISHKKGIYIDGHEREDVVKYRKEYLKIINGYRDNHQPRPLCSDERPPSPDANPTTPSESDDKKLVMIYHDESIFNTNEAQTWMWGTSDKPAILPKTKGSGIMVSDFIEEHDGFLRLNEEEHAMAVLSDPSFPRRDARELFEYGAAKEGYWTGEKFMAQIERACKIAEYKYTPAMHTLVWLFDQSSCHKAYAPDALNAKNNMNVKPGGAQPILRDTVWAGKIQMKMVLQRE